VHFKTLLSAFFTHAIRLGILDGEVTISGTRKTVFGNPMRSVRVPEAPEGEDPYAYSNDEVNQMLAYLPRPASVMVAVAAYAGLRRSELAGLLWENYSSLELAVTRSVWEGHANQPKTKKSKAPVPVIPRLRSILDLYRLECGDPVSGPIFRSARGTPLNMNNVLNRMILPALNRCEVCRKAERDHASEDHDYRRDPSRPEWHGWHGFRRGLATNLNQFGIDDSVIQRILRHSHVSVTQACYIKTVPRQAVDAMHRFEKAYCAPLAFLEAI
jgi:integrase